MAEREVRGERRAREAGGGEEGAEIVRWAGGAGGGYGRVSRSPRLALSITTMIGAFTGVLLYSFLSSSEAWQNRPSGIQCARKDIHEPILLVVSMDGFAARYLDLGLTPNIEAMGRTGARAQHIYSVFPSRTFQNHYTIATGLWAESHGIVDNYILDRSISNEVEGIARTTKQGYFRGDPIWSAYKRQRGGTTACLNWIGCAMNVSGFMPDYAPPYNGKATTEDRIDTVLSWLGMAPNGRPNFIMAYLNEPDETGHHRKSDDEIYAVLRENDAVIDRLMSGIERLGLIDCVNVLLVSDHGMTEITDRFYWDQFMSLDGLTPAYGTVGRIYRNGTSRSDDTITAPFQCKRGGKYKVYSRKTLPVKYHYASPRVGDFLFEGQPGTTFYATRSDDWNMTGDHGYDPVHPTMRTIFFARGPSIRPGVVTQPFQNVEYFNIFSELLGMRPELTPTNGTLGLVDEIFSRPPPRITTILTIPSCSAVHQIRSCDTQRCSQDKIVRLASRVTRCIRPPILSSISTLFFTPTSFCSLRLCGFEILTGPSTVVSEFATPNSIQNSSPPCIFETEDRYCMPPSSHNTSIVLTNLLLSTSDELSGISRAHTPLLQGFVRNFLDPLNDITRRMVAKYGRVGVITGTAFDSNSDGKMDEDAVRLSSPSHIFRILFICPVWRTDGLGCFDPSETRPLTFILPHIERDLNCLSTTDYLFAHTARVRDVEELTGLRFFSDPNVIPHEISLKIRTFVPQKLWDF